MLLDRTKHLTFPRTQKREIIFAANSPAKYSRFIGKFSFARLPLKKFKIKSWACSHFWVISTLNAQKYNALKSSKNCFNSAWKSELIISRAVGSAKKLSKISLRSLDESSLKSDNSPRRWDIKRGLCNRCGLALSLSTTNYVGFFHFAYF